MFFGRDWDAKDRAIQNANVVMLNVQNTYVLHDNVVMLQNHTFTSVELVWGRSPELLRTSCQTWQRTQGVRVVDSGSRGEFLKWCWQFAPLAVWSAPWSRGRIEREALPAQECAARHSMRCSAPTVNKSDLESKDFLENFSRSVFFAHKYEMTFHENSIK